MLPVLATVACDGGPPASENETPRRGMFMSLSVRPSTDPCGPAPAGSPLRDGEGTGWWNEGKRWCRQAADGRPLSAWISGASGPGTKRLLIGGDRIALTDAMVDLRPVAAQAVPTPFAACGTDIRSRAFAAGNFVRQPGDFPCGTRLAGPGFTLTVAGFPGPDNAMPAIVSHPDERPRGTIVYLPGGPYGNIINSGLALRAALNHFLSHWAGNARLVVPSYVGIDQVRTGPGDVARARAEIDRLITALETRGPVCVVGFSLGTSVAAASVARHPGTQFLLISPLAPSPETYAARVRANGGVAKPVTLASTIPGTPSVTVATDKALLDYFAGSETRDLASLLGPGPHPNVSIAFASGDLAVSRSDLGSLAEGGSIRRLTQLHGIDHSIDNAYNFAAYRPVLDGFLGDCLGEGKGTGR
jgi:pimeloyl-ACP methyl ester carboxylesterase